MVSERQLRKDWMSGRGRTITGTTHNPVSLTAVKQICVAMYKGKSCENDRFNQMTVGSTKEGFDDVLECTRCHTQYPIFEND